jgi:hypothetical protein
MEQEQSRICKRLRCPGINAKESIPPGWESIPELFNRFTNTGSGLFHHVLVNFMSSNPERSDLDFKREKRSVGLYD